MALVAYSDSEGEEEEAAIQKGAVPPTARQQISIPRPAKKRRLSIDKHEAPSPSESPPPLPASFHNLYSSSVRVSTRDDPSLHGGRKRIVPHIPGNWATHVYLEWLPNSTQHTLLSNLITAVTNSSALNTTPTPTLPEIHSLVETPLGVTTPLHISLSAPLVLRTETKDTYLSTLLSTLTPIANAHKPAITTSPDNLSWHLNEDGSRGFLVLRVLEIPHRHGQGHRALPDEQGEEVGEAEKQQRQRQHLFSSLQDENVVDGQRSGLGHRHGQGGQHADTQSKGRGDGGDGSSSSSSGHGLNDLLHASNKVAKAFEQPELYVAKERNRAIPSSSTGRGDFSGYFHISIAWALDVPASHQPTKLPNQPSATANMDDTEGEHGAWPPEVEEVLAQIKKMRIAFNEVKVRIGKDVTDIPFGAKKRAEKKSFFGN